LYVFVFLLFSFDTPFLRSSYVPASLKDK